MQRKRLIAILATIYHRRYVTLFILCAVFVSTISPVASLMELEQNVISRSCDELSESKLLKPSVSLNECKNASLTSGYSHAAIKFEDTKNHFLQIAMWPLVATVYGWFMAVVIWLLKRDDDESVEASIEALPHVQHVLSILLIAAMTFIAYLQNVIGT